MAEQNEKQDKTVGLNIKLMPVDHSDQPVLANFTRLNGAPAPLGRLDVFLSPPPQVTGFYLIDSLIAGNLELFTSGTACHRRTRRRVLRFC